MIIGNAIYLGGTPLPTLTNPAVAGDIRYGKQSIDGDGELLTGTIPDYEGETDTGSVIPVDTGADGLYKSMIEGNVTEIIDDTLMSIREDAQTNNTSLVKVSLPNVTSVGQNAFRGCSSITGVVDLRNASIRANAFYGALRRTVVLKIASNSQGIDYSKVVHLWIPDGYSRGANYEYYNMSNTKSIQYDDMKSSFSFVMCGGLTALKAFVVRKNTLISLAGAGLSGYDSSVFRFYVPSALLNDYKTATNWTAYASLMVGIDEDTMCAVSTTFIPTTSAVGIDHWDVVDLQSYTTYSAFDSTIGAVTTNHDGRLLIRGLDSNGDIKHVTYLQIGTGFDEEANLAD